jgi:hypothetical protein
VAPPVKSEPTIARLQYDMIMAEPYRYTSDDVIFRVHARRKGLPGSEEQRRAFFSKGQPCLRSSPLAKAYGWGIHCDSRGRVALYAKGSPEYEEFRKAKGLKHLKAMRNAKADAD